MARARLHIICGNCGSNDMFEYRIVTEINDDTNKEEQRISIACNNCSTLHCLEDNATKKN
jgi:uncharacterized Zn finger protein